jgi:hypothetical protein
VTDLAGEPLATYAEAWDIARGPEATLDRLETLIEQTVAASPVGQADIVGLGAGLPGPVEFAPAAPSPRRSCLAGATTRSATGPPSGSVFTSSSTTMSTPWRSVSSGQGSPAASTTSSS